jgi:hypothetical protein
MELNRIKWRRNAPDGLAEPYMTPFFGTALEADYASLQHDS